MCIVLKMKILKQNKRADLPTLILVVLIFALLIVALFSFYFAGNKQAQVINDASYLMEFNNFADSVKYSVHIAGAGAYQWYEGVKLENREIIIERSFDNDNLRAKYVFAP